MPRSTTHVIEDIGSMGRHPEHVALVGHGVEGNQLAKVCMIGGCWWLEGLTRGLDVIPPRIKSRN